MYHNPNTRSPADVTSRRFLRQALLGAVFLGGVAMVSLPAARGAGPIGWMPLWLLGMPLSALAALALADLGAPNQLPRAPAAAIASVPPRRRARLPQARRRGGARRAPAPRLPESPAAA